jgi:hypothetical protein
MLICNREQGNNREAEERERERTRWRRDDDDLKAINIPP